MARHPWEKTLGELLAHAKRERGVEPIWVDGPAVAGICLVVQGQSYPLPANFDEDSILPLEYLESLCRFLGVPREDFGLDALDE